MPEECEDSAWDSDLIPFPAESGVMDTGAFVNEREELARNKNVAGKASLTTAGVTSDPPAPLETQLWDELDMMSWSTHIDTVAERTPIVSLRAGPSRERRRTIALLMLYASIFVLALAMSLDSMSFYLYLNYACSEFDALSSIGTIMIVQQLVRAICKPPVAKLSDAVGRISTMVLLLGTYVAGNAVMASATSFNMLAIGTVFQSLGSTGLQVLQSVIVADTTSVQWRGLLIATVNMPYLINFAVTGPFVNYVMTTYGWRGGYAFWIACLPLSAVPLLVTLTIGHRRARRRSMKRKTHSHSPPASPSAWGIVQEMDLLGMGLFSSGLTLILLPMSLGGFAALQQGWTSERWQLGFGCMMLACFAWWETRASMPFLPFQAVSNSTVIMTCTIAALDFAGFYLSWTYLAPFIMILKDWDQLQTAYFVSAQNVTSTITGMLVGILMAYTRRLKKFLTYGYIIRVLGVLMMIRYRTEGHSALSLILCQVLQGMGGGSIAVTMQVAVQVAVPPARVAVVTAMELLTTEVGAAFGSAFASALFTAHLRPTLARDLPSMTPAELDHIQGDLSAVLNYPIGSMERKAIAQTWVSVMRVLCIASLLVQLPALVLTFCVPDLDLHDSHSQHRRRNTAQDIERDTYRDCEPGH
ncbi:hypothetical protein MYAM1_003656 [Malassezia yamatoensis]|uniref:Major facilitator superfamily (MFS) profile domain-containing protein n=1 Tax=Malassezia yamatoensis TaxID=253288 RepID=A0AAJ5Z230_9BASI|nr:hypothetical protein MYAM1_003656 [Malassezia yamatoensis]